MIDIKIMAIVPARGGSKEVKHKNIKIICGKPLIQYTIETIQNSKDLFYKSILSTDDRDIINICKKLPIEIPFKRPKHLADDNAKMIDVVRHAVTYIETKNNITLDWVMLLQPTMPFRTRDDILNSIKLAQENECDSVISVKQVFATHPILMKEIKDGMLSPYCVKEGEGTRRQDYKPDAYMRNGGIYLTKRDVIIKSESLWGKKIIPYIMPDERSVGIDSQLDLELVRILMSKMQSK